jgi:hypothetical protein
MAYLVLVHHDKTALCGVAEQQSPLFLENVENHVLGGQTRAETKSQTKSQTWRDQVSHRQGVLSMQNASTYCTYIRGSPDFATSHLMGPSHHWCLFAYPQSGETRPVREQKCRSSSEI